MIRISTFATIGAAGVLAAATLTGCSSSGSKPAASGTLGSTTSVGSTNTGTNTTGAAQSTSSSAPQTSPSTSTSAPAPSSPPGTTSPSAPASTPGVIPTHGGTPKCTTAEMPAGTWKPVPGSSGAGHVSADIAFRNASTHPCTVTGYPAIQQLASDEHPLPTNVVHFPTTVTTVTVAPGAWIHSEIRYSPNIPGEGEPPTGDCEPETVHARAQLPADTKWAPVTLSEPTTVCEKGTIQAKPFVSGESSPAGG